MSSGKNFIGGNWKWCRRLSAGSHTQAEATVLYGNKYLAFKLYRDIPAHKVCYMPEQKKSWRKRLPSALLWMLSKSRKTLRGNDGNSVESKMCSFRVFFPLDLRFQHFNWFFMIFNLLYFWSSYLLNQKIMYFHHETKQLAQKYFVEINIVSFKRRYS